MYDFLCSMLMPCCSWCLVYHIHWLRVKSTRDRWMEEVEILTNEVEWTRNLFRHRANFWEGLETKSWLIGDCGVACYSARQYDLYCKLAGMYQWQHEPVCILIHCSPGDHGHIHCRHALVTCRLDSWWSQSMHHAHRSNSNLGQSNRSHADHGQSNQNHTWWSK